MALNFKKSIGSPISVDIGNQVTQGRIVSKTIQFGLFTTNKNAIWAGNQQLLKESYPFAYISIPVNRNMFRLQVGDVFKFSYAKYGVENMICRVLQIEEQDLKSEKIVIHAMEDIYSIANSITEYTEPVDNASTPSSYEITVFATEQQQVIELPYYPGSPSSVGDGSIVIAPIASIDDPLILGFDVYMSVDSGASYSFVGKSEKIQPYGTITNAYGLTFTIDLTEGILVDFVAGQDRIENEGWADVFSGNVNVALLGDEFISFQSVTPVTSTQYSLENIIRGRFGSEKQTHSSGETFTVISLGFLTIENSELVAGAERLFKFLPYNSKNIASLADAIPMTITVSGTAKTPYRPINFLADDERVDPRYTSGEDITLTWSPRFRGKGAGIGIPGVVLADDDHEGLFEIEVWVSSVLVRTTTDLDVVTWDYTNAMNVSDNGSAAQEITFKLLNFIVESGIVYSSEETTVITTKY